MKYRFIFKKSGYQSQTTYEKEMESFGRYTAEEMFHDACCLLDFGIFDEVLMFDETGHEYKELY
jgi:hypothetical protein